MDNPAPIEDWLSFHIEVECNVALKTKVVWSVSCLRAACEADDDYYALLNEDCMSVNMGKSTMDLSSHGVAEHRRPVNPSDVVKECIFKVTGLYRGEEFLGIEFPCKLSFPEGVPRNRRDKVPCVRELLLDEARIVQLPCRFDE